MFLLTEPGIASVEPVELSSLVQLEGVNFDRMTMTAVTDSDLGHMSAFRLVELLFESEISPVSCPILGQTRLLCISFWTNMP